MVLSPLVGMREEKLTGWAYDFEQRTHGRKNVEPVVKLTTQLLLDVLFRN